jgi:hypothetical protein
MTVAQTPHPCCSEHATADLLGMRAVGRFLEPSERRAIAIRAVLGIGTAVLVAIVLQLRQWWGG